MNWRGAAAAMVTALLLSAPASAQELMPDHDVGNWRVLYVLAGTKMALADPAGFTVYTYAKDEIGKSNCTDACAEAWPPILAGGNQPGVGSLSTFQREDGQYQWAYEGKPLYSSVKDTASGQANGHGVDDAWFIVETVGHEM